MTGPCPDPVIEDDTGAVSGGFRRPGHSKDHRPDLPQIVIGLAVTRTGIPVRVWSWPGNSADTTLIAQVRSDLREWSLSRIIYAADRGFASEANRRTLMAGGDGYILGEKLRSGSPHAKAALARQGRYSQVAGNMLVKEVRIQDTTGAHDRFIVCFNPDQATRDAAIRDQLVAQLGAMIEGTDQQAATKRAELRGKISTMPGLNRFLRVTPAGLLRVDKTKITTEANLDGKYLLRTSHPTMSAEDVALGYKQLLQVERAWRDMKSTLDLRPVYHRREERIRAHVDLCWLAPLPAEDLLYHARATGAVLVADETRRTGGVSESVFTALIDAGYHGRLARVTSEDSFVPLGPAADTVLLTEDAVVAAARSLLA